jgi:hypothetical protein
MNGVSCQLAYRKFSGCDPFMIGYTVPMTRAIRLRNCMTENGHVQFCSGRGRSNPPPDRNHLRLEGPLGEKKDP